MAQINGNEVLLTIGGTTISCSTSNTFSVTRETIDITTKCSSNWAEVLAGKMSWETSIDGVYDESKSYNFTEIFTDIVAGSTVTVRFGDGGGLESGKIYWTGNAIITNITQDAPQGDRVTWSATLTGDGALTECTFT